MCPTLALNIHSSSQQSPLRNAGQDPWIYPDSTYLGARREWSLSNRFHTAHCRACRRSVPLNDAIANTPHVTHTFLLSSVSSSWATFSRPWAEDSRMPCTILPTWIADGVTPGWISRGFGRLVTHVCGHISTLAGCNEPSRNFLLVSQRWIPPNDV